MAKDDLSLLSKLSYNCFNIFFSAEPMLPDLLLNFLEHAKWDRLKMHRKHMSDLAWWRTNLQGASLVPLLTTDYPRSNRVNLGNNNGDVVKVRPLP